MLTAHARLALFGKRGREERVGLRLGIISLCWGQAVGLSALLTGSDPTTVEEAITRKVGVQAKGNKLVSSVPP